MLVWPAMRKLLRLGGIALALVLVGLFAFGWLQPREHTASSRLTLRAAPEVVWSLITDHDAMTGWRSDVKKVERGPDQDGKVVWVETSGFGKLPLRVEAAEAPRLYRLKIAADDLGFGGTWTYRIEPAGAGCTLTITEDGFVDSLVFRALGPLMGGHHATIDAYLRDVAQKLGETAEPQHVTA